MRKLRVVAGMRVTVTIPASNAIPRHRTHPGYNVYALADQLRQQPAAEHRSPVPGFVASRLWQIFDLMSKSQEWSLEETIGDHR